MITIPGAIKKINSDYRVLMPDFMQYESGIDDNRSRFNIEFKIRIAKSNELIRNAKHIELYFLSSSSNNADFNNQFSNMFHIKKEDNNKKYKQESILAKNSSINLTSSYNSTYNNLNQDNLVYKIDFDEEDYNQGTDLYSVRVGYRFSNQLFRRVNSFTDLRVAILDESNNIIDISSFYEINLSPNRIRQKIERVSIEEFYENQIEEIEKSLSLDFSSPMFNFTSSFLPGGFKFTVDFEYKGKKISSIINTYEQSSRLKIEDVRNSANLIKRHIVYDYLSDIENYTFNLNINIQRAVEKTEKTVNFNDSSDLDTYNEFTINNNALDTLVINNDDTYNSSRINTRDADVIGENGEGESIVVEYINLENGSITKRFNLNKSSEFIQSILDRNEESVRSEILNNINFKSSTIRKNDSINKYCIPIELQLDSGFNTQSILEKLVIDSIIIEDNNNLEFFYLRPEFTLENKFEYKGKSLYNLFSNSSELEIWHPHFDLYSLFDFLSNYSVKIIYKFVDSNETLEKNIEIRIDYTQIQRVQANLVNEIQKVPNETNLIFKQNLICTNTNLDLFLEADDNFINHERFLLNNITNFSNPAIVYGYKREDGSADIQSFLRNCKLKILYKSYIRNTNKHESFEYYFNFEDFFETSDLSNVQSKIINFENNRISSKTLIENASSISNQDYVSFFYSKTYEEKIRILSLLENLSIGSDIEISILPIPKLIIENLGVGLSILENVEVLENIVPELQLLLVSYFNISTSTNSNSSDAIKKLLFSNNVNERVELQSAETFIPIFEFFQESSIYSNSVFQKESEFNKEQISKKLNSVLDNPESSGLVNFLERNLSFPSAFRNFSINDTFVSFKNFPVSLSFREFSYDSNSNCYIPEAIEFNIDVNSKMSLDMSYFDSSLSNVRVIDIIENSVDQVEIVNFNQSLQFLISIDDAEDIDLAAIITRGDIIYLTQYKENRCVTNIVENLHVIPSEQNEFNFINKRQINRRILDLNDQSLFGLLKDSTVNKISSIILRNRMTFKVKRGIYKNAGEIDLVFSKEIPRVNLVNQSIKINNIKEIRNNPFSN